MRVGTRGGLLTLLALSCTDNASGEDGERAASAYVTEGHQQAYQVMMDEAPQRGG